MIEGLVLAERNTEDSVENARLSMVLNDKTRSWRRWRGRDAPEFIFLVLVNK